MTSPGAGLRVTVVGATGLVGREIVSSIEERWEGVSALRLYASDRSAGEEVGFQGRTVRVERLAREPSAADVAFLAATAEVSQEIAEDLVDTGALVIDLTGAYRDDPEVRLLAAGSVAGLPGGGLLVRVPDALTVLLHAPLQALAERSPLQRVIATGFVSASAFGTRRIDGLGRASAALLNFQATGEDASPEDALAGDGPGGEEAEDRKLAFSCRPVTAGERASGACAAEPDLGRLLGPGVSVIISPVRVAAFHGHAATVSVRTVEVLSRETVAAALREAPSVIFAEDASGTRDVVGSAGIHVGGLRTEEGGEGWSHFWVAADNLRQGAGLNVVSVAEACLRPRGFAL